MIRKSLAKFIKANVSELTDVIIPDQEFVISDYPKPFVTVSLVNQVNRNWILGDDKRQVDVALQVSLFCQSLDEQIRLKAKLINKLENSTATLQGMTPNVYVGIPLMGLYEQLSSTDLYNYYATNPFDVTVVPKVYKNGTLANPLDYAVNYSMGRIVFTVAQSSTDVIRCDYLAGIFEFNINSVVDAPVIDVANKTHLFNSYLTLTSFLYVKEKAHSLN